MLVIKNTLCFICLLFHMPKVVYSQFRVSGGTTTRNRLAKYVVSIRDSEVDKVNFGSGHMCGGTIIGEKLILTAAHCLYPLVIIKDSRNSPLYVVIGTRFRNLYSRRYTQIFKVSDFQLHPLYDHRDEYYDIGLLWTHQSIHIDGVTADIMELPKDEPRDGMLCTVAGWGQIYDRGPLPDEILFANIHIVSEKECRKDYPAKSDNDFCATNVNDIDVDTCKGDSGGPLFCYGQLYGVTSRGTRCGAYNRSGLYSNVYKYIEWIKSNHASRIQILAKYTLWLYLIHLICFLRF